MRAWLAIALAGCSSKSDPPPTPVVTASEPTWFDAAGDFGDGLAPVKTNGKWGYIDKHGRFAIAPRYRHATPFVRGFAVVEPTAIIDVRGEQVIAASRLRSVDRIFEATIWSGQLDETTCVFDRTATCIADVALAASGALVVVKKGDRQGIVDRDGIVLVPFEHAELSIRDYRVWSRGSDGKWRMLDVEGTPIVDPQDRPPNVPYVSHSPRDGMIRVDRDDTRTGFYSVDGRPLVVK